MNRLNKIFLFSIVLLSACTKNSENIPVARVYDKFLYKSDLINNLPRTLVKEDSIKRAELFVNNWLRQQVVIRQAYLEMDVNEDSYQNRLDNYKDELIIYDFENELLGQKLDSPISDEELIDFYNENMDNYVLKNHVAKVRYAIFEEDIEGLRQFGRWMRRDGDNMENLANFAKDHAVQYDLEADDWMDFGLLANILPINNDRLKLLIRAKGYQNVQDEGKEYFVQVVASYQQGEIAPFAMVKDKIELTLLNKRKSELLKKMREDLYRESVSNGELEIFKKN